MDCLSFRSVLLANPSCNDDAVVRHIAECQACADYRRELLHFESRLENVINRPLPKYLPARILVRQSSKSRRLGLWRLSAALAACVALAVVIGLYIVPVEPSAGWQAAVQHYLNHDPVASGPLGHRDVDAVLNGVGVSLSAGVGEIVVAEPCVIGKRRGAHLVVAGKQGPVTVLIMPQIDIARAVEVQTAAGVGIIAPCPRGSIAVLGGASEAIDEIRRRFESAMSFI